MASVGSLESCDGGEFTAYQERLEAFFIANGIGQVDGEANEAELRNADKKKVVTLNLCYNFSYWKESLFDFKRCMPTS
jgi:hypothetical protein